jgi:hypothetical protein
LRRIEDNRCSDNWARKWSTSRLIYTRHNPLNHKNKS